VNILANAGIMALLSMAVSLAPLGMGITYAIRPSEARLALMRPLSLAGIFSALTGFCLGLMNSLVGLGNASTPLGESRVWMFGLAESITTLFIGFGCLTVGWLCVALGMRRQTLH
jgi:hypothetical protein